MIDWLIDYCTANDLAFAPAGSLGNLGGIGSGLKTFLQSLESNKLFCDSLSGDDLGNVQCLITFLGLLTTTFSSLGIANNKVSTFESHGITIGLELRRWLVKEIFKLGKRGFWKSFRPFDDVNANERSDIAAMSLLLVEGFIFLAIGSSRDSWELEPRVVPMQTSWFNDRFIFMEEGTNVSLPMKVMDQEIWDKTTLTICEVLSSK